MGFDRVTVVSADVRDQASVAAAIAGADAVVNTVSAYIEKSGVTFEAVHVQGADAGSTGGCRRRRRPPRAGLRHRRGCRIQGLLTSVLEDAANRGPAESLELRSSARAPCLARATRLFSTLAELARLLPALPLIGGGHTRLQPVFVEDVAEAVASHPHRSRNSRPMPASSPVPGVYALGEKLVTMTLHLMGKRQLLIPVPFAVAEIQARLFRLFQTHRSPPAKLIFSRRIMLRAGPCPVCRSSRFENGWRGWYRRTLGLGHPDRTDQSSEIDDHPPSLFPARISAAGRHVVESHT